MAWTQDDVDALKALYKRGVRSVSFNGETVTYTSAAEMWEAIQRIERSLGGQPATVRPAVRRVRFREPN